MVQYYLKGGLLYGYTFSYIRYYWRFSVFSAISDECYKKNLRSQ